MNATAARFARFVTDKTVSKLLQFAAVVDALRPEPLATAKNISGERIETLRFCVPALRVGVLNYAPGQLQTKNQALAGKEINLYYPPEAVSDPAFLKSLENSPIILGDHESSTNENNKKIEGWPRVVKFDPTENAAMIEGVVKGAKEAAYVRSNFTTPDFGASAMVDVHGLEVRDGVTPDGKTFNAVATKLHATHVTLAPSVRDPENKIEIINTVAINSRGKILGGDAAKEKGAIEMDEKQIAAIVANTVRAEMTAKNSEDRLSTIENTVNELKNAFDEMKKAKPPVENAEGEPKPKTEPTPAENTDEPATLENALPSQKLVGTFATAYNAEFKGRTPSFEALASLAGIKAETRADVITAVNAKFAELQAAVTVKNTVTGQAAAGSVF